MTLYAPIYRDARGPTYYGDTCYGNLTDFLEDVYGQDQFSQSNEWKRFVFMLVRHDENHREEMSRSEVEEAGEMYRRECDPDYGKHDAMLAYKQDIASARR